MLKLKFTFVCIVDVMCDASVNVIYVCIVDVMCDVSVKVVTYGNNSQSDVIGVLIG